MSTKMSQVRAKFFIRSIEMYHEPADSGSVKMSAVYGTYGDGKENESWSKYTPSGEINMSITNPTAFAVFKEAFDNKKSFYVDFTEAETR